MSRNKKAIIAFGVTVLLIIGCLCDALVFQRKAMRQTVKFSRRHMKTCLRSWVLRDKES